MPPFDHDGRTLRLPRLATRPRQRPTLCHRIGAVARPFVVEADGTRLRALGTKFDVRRDADVVRVTLLEGRVQVARVDQPAGATLAPNQQLTVTARGISPVRPTDAAEASGWTSGRL